jgi:hypothetical protein
MLRVGRVLSYCFKLVSAGVSLSEDSYEEFRVSSCKTTPRWHTVFSSWDAVLRAFQFAQNASFDGKFRGVPLEAQSSVLKDCVGYNHRVVSVDFEDVEDEPVFCLEVPDYGNFALSAGVFVHNCPSQLYHGYSYMGDQLQYLYGLPREKRFPKIRNPQLQNTTCFVAGTLVLTAYGLRPIESINKWDLVWTHKGRVRQVISTMKSVKSVVPVKIQGEAFWATPEHPFLADPVGEVWKPFFEAREGDRVFSPDFPVRKLAQDSFRLQNLVNGFWSYPLHVGKETHEDVVYNLSVVEDESFLIGTGCWAVHNCKHTHMALEEILSSKEKVVKMFSEYYKRLPETPEDTMIAIPAPKDGGQSAEPEVHEFEETGDVDVVLPDASTAEAVPEPEVISTEDPESPGTVYVDTRLAEDSLPEDQRARYEGDEDSGEEGAEGSVPAVGSVSEEEAQALGDEIDEASVSPRSDDERFATEWAWQSRRRGDVG